MSERPRISVLRFRQLSTGRFYVRATRSMSGAASGNGASRGRARSS